MIEMASQITSLAIVYSIVYSDADQRKHQSSASLAFVRRIHRGPVNSPHKWPVMRKMFPFDDVIMINWNARSLLYHGWYKSSLVNNCIAFWLPSDHCLENMVLLTRCYRCRHALLYPMSHCNISTAWYKRKLNPVSWQLSYVSFALSNRYVQLTWVVLNIFQKKKRKTNRVTHTPR